MLAKLKSIPKVQPTGGYSLNQNSEPPTPTRPHQPSDETNQESVTIPAELSSIKMPPRMIPSSIPGSWNPDVLIFAPGALSVGFFSSPNWYSPPPDISFGTAAPCATKGFKSSE